MQGQPVPVTPDAFQTASNTADIYQLSQPRRITLRALFAGAVIGVLAWVVSSHWDLVLQACRATVSRPWLIPLGIAGSLAFNLFKARSLRTAAFACAVQLSSARALQAVLEGTVIEAVSWPGKVIGDTYRIWRLGTQPLRARAAAIVAWRIGSMAASTVLISLSSILLAVAGGALASTLAGAFAIALGIILAHRLRSRGSLKLKALAACTGLSFIASLADVLSMSAIAWALAGVSPLDFGPRFVIIAAVGALSMLPLGVGVLDAACWLVLTRTHAASSETATAVILCYRALGPGVSVALGGASLLLRTKCDPSADKNPRGSPDDGILPATPISVACEPSKVAA